jgi:hypothetical protein
MSYVPPDIRAVEICKSPLLMERTFVMKIPCDPDVAETMKSKIDACEFQAVKFYFRNPSSEIDQVVLVQQDYLLEEVAAFLAAPVGERVEEGFLSIIRAGVVKFGVDDFRGVRPAYERHAVLLDSIPDDQLCYVIYLPPMYVAKVSEEKWD